MIDWKRTKKETGYNKEYFDKYPKSRKLIYRICDGCGEGKWIKKQSYTLLCGSCAAKKKLENKENHPMYGKRGECVGMYGKKHTKETKQKMRDSSPRISGEDHWNFNGITSEETKIKMHDASIGKLKSEKHKVNMSKNHADVNGANNPAWNGGIANIRKHILSINQCLKINERFTGSHAHHISADVVIYIPEKLHRHISHNLKNGEGMNEMNMLSLQYIRGWL